MVFWSSILSIFCLTTRHSSIHCVVRWQGFQFFIHLVFSVDMRGTTSTVIAGSSVPNVDFKEKGEDNHMPASALQTEYCSFVTTPHGRTLKRGQLQQQLGPQSKLKAITKGHSRSFVDEYVATVAVAKADLGLVLHVGIQDPSGAERKTVADWTTV